MESYWDTLVEATGNSYETGAGIEFEDLPQLDEPLYLLGEAYSTIHDREEIRQDVLSRLWITYRKDFPPIGGSDGPRVDRGWGCMLRCGQMLLAEAINRIKLGREWRWCRSEFANNQCYRQLLLLFQDCPAATYSIHKIASMGVSDGKPVGQWFGPNTVAQAIRKLAPFDNFSNLVVHVALDNTVIIEDLKTLIRSRKTAAAASSASTSAAKPMEECNSECEDQPLLLFIPLRLGLSELNTQYLPALKESLQLKQSLGMIGGRPNSAHYFIGYQGNDLFYLDPHTTQDCAQLLANGEAAASAAAAAAAAGATAVLPPDASYHTVSMHRMPFHKLDPSLALAFVCKSESELDNLCATLVRRIVQSHNSIPLFEMQQQRPNHWPPFQPDCMSQHFHFEAEQQEDEEDDSYVLL